MTETDWTTVGMAEAAQRAGLHPVESQYREIQARPIGNVEPYQPQEENVEPIIPRRLARQMVVASWGAFTVSGAAGLFQVVASGAMNTIIGWGIGIFAGVGLLSGLFGGNCSEKTNSSKQGETHYHYHQYNNQGGNANQNNGK